MIFWTTETEAQAGAQLGVQRVRPLRRESNHHTLLTAGRINTLIIQDLFQVLSIPMLPILLLISIVSDLSALGLIHSNSTTDGCQALLTLTLRMTTLESVLLLI